MTHPTQDRCIHCGSAEAAHEPSDCCGDGGGSTFASEDSMTDLDLIERLNILAAHYSEGSLGRNTCEAAARRIEARKPGPKDAPK